MNDPYNGNGRKSPEDDLGRSIEKEVKETIGTVAAALQDAAREVSTSLRDNESVQRTVKDLGAAARDGVQGIQSAIAQAQKNAEKEKRRRKRRDYAKKANGALSEAGGLMLPAGILAACAFSAFEPGDPAGALILGFISLWFSQAHLAHFSNRARCGVSPHTKACWASVPTAHCRSFRSLRAKAREPSAKICSD